MNLNDFNVFDFVKGGDYKDSVFVIRYIANKSHKKHIVKLVDKHRTVYWRNINSDGWERATVDEFWEYKRETK